MGIGSLTKYRKWIMIGGFVIFAMGSIGRWHRERQLGRINHKAKQVEKGNSPWEQSCRTYACQTLKLRGRRCDLLCQEAISDGEPKVGAERIARACKKSCQEAENVSSCRTDCLIEESRKTAK